MASRNIGMIIAEAPTEIGSVIRYCVCFCTCLYLMGILRIMRSFSHCLIQEMVCLDCNVACWCMRCSACHSQATGSHIKTRSGNGHLGRTMSREGSTPEGHTRASDSNGHRSFVGKVTSPRALPGAETQSQRAHHDHRR